MRESKKKGETQAAYTKKKMFAVKVKVEKRCVNSIRGRSLPREGGRERWKGWLQQEIRHKKRKQQRVVRVREGHSEEAL